MNPLIQYLKDTRGELHHVAWPTRTQTIVYTILIAIICVVLAVYLGVFDYLFNNALKHSIGVFGGSSNPVTITQTPIVHPSVIATPSPTPTFIKLK